MREKTIEKKLVIAIKEAGGIAPKFVSPGFDGMPDRIVLLPGGHMGFVEVKAPGKVPRPLQEARHRMLRRLGCKVYVLDRPEQIIQILEDTHRVVAENILGRRLNADEVVHHVDGNPRNNDPDNIRVFPSQKEHAEFHAKLHAFFIRGGDAK